MRDSRLKRKQQAQEPRRKVAADRRERRRARHQSSTRRSKLGPGRRRTRLGDVRAARRLRSLKRLAIKVLGRTRARTGARLRGGVHRSRRKLPARA